MEFFKKPWLVIGRELRIPSGNSSRVLAVVSTYKTDEANVRLLESSPKLFEALTEVLECGPNVGHNTELMEQIKDLLIKIQLGDG